MGLSTKGPSGFAAGQEGQRELDTVAVQAIADACLV